MTVAELIVRLSKLNPHAEVILSSDPEGNSFRPLSDLTEGRAWNEGRIVQTVEYNDRPEADGVA